MGLFIGIFREMRKMIGPSARITAVVATLGALALFGQFSVDEYVYDALKAGAGGFLLKDVRRDDLARGPRDRRR